MTTAFRTAYESLLLDYLPRPVRTQREYEQACRQIAKLMSRGPELPQAESELLEILSLLVAQYESMQPLIRDASPAEMLAFLLDARGVSNAAVARETGIPRSVITDILAGRRRISMANVAKLAKYFHVSPAVFIAEPAAQPPVSARPRTRTGRTSSQSVTGKPPEEQIKEACPL
jgi:HTH-type transcriptional regulator / antitoxin HigA